MFNNDNVKEFVKESCKITNESVKELNKDLNTDTLKMYLIKKVLSYDGTKLYLRRKNGNPNRIKDYLKKTYTINRKSTIYDNDSERFTFYVKYVNVYFDLTTFNLRLKDYGTKWVIDEADWIPYIQVF